MFLAAGMAHGRPVQSREARWALRPWTAVGISIFLIVGALAAALSGTVRAEVVQGLGTTGGVWRNATPAGSPSSRYAPVMAYEAASERLILFSGQSHMNDTWSYDPNVNQWMNLDATGPPPPGYMGAPAMAYDTQAHRVILFGVDWPWPNETWAFNPAANLWTNLLPPASPSARHDASIAYDNLADRILLFGGGDVAPHHPYSSSNDTWSYSYVTNSWTQLHPAKSPDRRLGGAMVYDSTADRVILFGGCANGIDFTCTLMNDTWIYRYASNEWTQVTPPVAPSPRSFAAAAYDSRDDAVLLFGGADGQSVLNDTWTYSFFENRWTNRTPSPSPPARRLGAMGYDPVRNQAILFGGSLATGFTFMPTNDTWTYTLSAGGASGAPTGELWLAPVLGLTAIAGLVVATVIWVLWRRAPRTNGP